MATLKKRNWAFVVYPESAPDDWLSLIESTGLQACVSPLHDRDINPTGEPKKPHWHVIVTYSGPTSLNVVKRLTDMLNAPNPQALEQVKGYYRYLTHMDNPEKAQYDEADIIRINGFNIRDFVDIDKSEVLRIKKELQGIIREKQFSEYSDLMDYVMDNCSDDYYDVASSHTIFLNAYLKSRQFRKQ